MMDFYYQNDYLKYNFDRLARLFAITTDEDGREHARILIERYRRLENIYSAPYEELVELVGKKCATAVRVLASVTSRRVTNRFTFGVSHTGAEIAEYFCALFLPLSVETVYAMLIAEDGAVQGVSKISTGTVNASEVFPRKIVEAALAYNAKRVVLAHNHPGGTSKPSGEDNALTRGIAETLMYAGLTLECSIIVACGECNVISDRSDIADNIK